MPERRRPGRLLGLGGLLGSLLVALPSASAAADELDTGGPVRLEADAETTFSLDDGRRFVDTLELRRAPDGSLVLINELSMDDYVAGVEEMPPRWHGEALRAQAVAARTYVWRSILQGTFRERGLGYDICATVDCQVFRGAGVVDGSPYGDRWRDAVDDTSGEVLLYEGEPILARYSSSSGGHMVPNEVVFPDSGPRPYLVGGEDPDDEVSPLHRWRVEFTREEFDDILSRGATLGPVVPVAAVERDGPLHDPHAEIVVAGEDGGVARVPAVELRRFVSQVAPQRHPDRFPSLRVDGVRPLPTTLPSSRFTIEVVDDTVVVEGRGWGHGVGMSQHGARGKALRGMTYDEILASYYNGLTPQRSGDVPARVRVGLDVGDGLAVRADGPFRLVAGEQEVAERALGTWEVSRVADGLRVRVPEHRSAPLEVEPTRVVGGGGAGQDDHVVVEADVNKPVELSLAVVDPAGDTVLERRLGVVEAGTHTTVWRFTDGDGERVAGGGYEVALLAVDEEGARGGEPVPVDVRRPADEDARAGGEREWGPPMGGLGALRLGLVVIAVLIGGAAIVGLVRRRP